MEIAGPRFKLRPFRADDADALVRYGNNRKIWINLVDAFPHPYTREEAEAWPAVANARPVEQGCNFAIEHGGEAIGSLSFGRGSDIHQKTANIGYWIGEPFWGRGIASEALALATRAAFEHYDFERIEAGVLGWNVASMRVLEKAGYDRESTQRCAGFKDGKVTDIVLYAKLRAASR